jgi:hypothetical protein
VFQGCDLASNGPRAQSGKGAKQDQITDDSHVQCLSSRSTRLYRQNSTPEDDATPADSL